MIFFDPLYLLLILPPTALALWANWRVKSTFKKYAEVPVATQMTGAQAARRLMDHYGLSEVKVEPSHGMLSDHYDPRSRTLRLSPEVYNGRTVSAVGVACHEAGHALQHRDGYLLLKFRSAMVPVASIGSRLAIPLIFIGLLIGTLGLAKVGVVLFAAAVAFTLVTVPVEINASARAMQIAGAAGLIVSEDERTGMSRVLTAAAWTYVAAALTAITQLIYFAMRAGLLGGSRD